MDEKTAIVRKVEHEVGMDVDALSVDELTELVGILGLEIERLEKEITKKTATRSAAEEAFKF